jgi:N-acetylglucosaminyl-diphospho-decaprenol L-rhamnosyltransferase
MPNQQPVIAAIHNYNMADNLRTLLPQVLAQGYDGVFVLDDASTDHSVEVVHEFGDDVTLVRSRENRGAGTNRNQIIDCVGDDALIHFIDADMDLDTPDIASIALKLAAQYADQGVGVIGGLVSRVDGSQEPHNYGPSFSLSASFTSGLPLLIDRFRDDPRYTGALRRLGASPLMRRWPNVLEPPRPTRTYWLHEGNMLIYASVLRSVGGYNPQIRNHEAQDFAIRLEKKGVKRQFDPSIRVIHHYIDVRGKNRSREEYEAVLYIIRTHGFKRWLTDI